MDASKFFIVTEKEGLGRVLKCKICNRYNKEFIVVSANDAERHLQYHFNKYKRGEGNGETKVLHRQTTLF